MESNLAYDDSYETVYNELIDGKFVAMSPSPPFRHNTVAENLFLIFSDFLRGKPCRPCFARWDVFLTQKDRIPSRFSRGIFPEMTVSLEEIFSGIL